MDVLVPIDGSDCSRRVLDFAVKLGVGLGARLHVVHFSDAETDATDEIRATATAVLDAHDVDADYELLEDSDLEFRPNDRVGKDILELVEREGYDHVVMGHHGSGTVERAILGSAAETVVRAETVPTTVIP